MQRRRPPPAADTGRSCWGSGLQDASAAQGTKQTQGAATRLSEAASFFVWSPSSLGLKGASSPFLVGPARRNRWHFSGSLLVSKENNPRPAASASKSPCPCRAKHTAFASQTGLRLKSPTGAFMPSGHRRPFWFSFGVKREHPLSKPLSPAAPPPPAGPARPAGRRPAAPRSHSAPPRCRAAHAEPARPQRPLPAP